MYAYASLQMEFINMYADRKLMQIQKNFGGMPHKQKSPNKTAGA